MSEHCRVCGGTCRADERIQWQAKDQTWAHVACYVEEQSQKEDDEASRRWTRRGP